MSKKTPTLQHCKMGADKIQAEKPIVGMNEGHKKVSNE